MKKNVFSKIAALSMLAMLAAGSVNAQTKSPGERVKEAANKAGVSAGRGTAGGAKVCERVGRRMEVCVEKQGSNPRNGWGGSIGWKFK